MTTTEEVKVLRIEEVPTKRGSALVRYSVHVRRLTSTGVYDLFSVSTVDPFKASLCQRAKETGRQIYVTWRPSKYWDQDLVSVWFPPEQETTA